MTPPDTQKDSAFFRGAHDPSSMINTCGTEAVQQEMAQRDEKVVGNKAGV